MSVSTEQEVSPTSPPWLSVDTQIVSDNLLATDEDLSATQKILAPYYSSDFLKTEVYVQDETEPTPL